MSSSSYNNKSIKLMHAFDEEQRGKPNAFRSVEWRANAAVTGQSSWFGFIEYYLEWFVAVFRCLLLLLLLSSLVDCMISIQIDAFAEV